MRRAMLPPSLMVTAIIGFLVSAVYTVTGKMDEWFDPEIWGEFTGTSLGFAFCLTFVIMFIASVISMTPTDEELGR